MGRTVGSGGRDEKKVEAWFGNMVRKEERNRHDGIGNGTGKAGNDGRYLQTAGGKQSGTY